MAVSGAHDSAPADGRASGLWLLCHVGVGGPSQGAQLGLQRTRVAPSGLHVGTRVGPHSPEPALAPGKGGGCGVCVRPVQWTETGRGAGDQPDTCGGAPAATTAGQAHQQGGSPGPGCLPTPGLRAPRKPHARSSGRVTATFAEPRAPVTYSRRGVHPPARQLGSPHLDGRKSPRENLSLPRCWAPGRLAAPGRASRTPLPLCKRQPVLPELPASRATGRRAAGPEGLGRASEGRSPVDRLGWVPGGWVSAGGVT